MTQAIQIEAFGNPAEVMKVVDIPDVGAPGEGEVVIDEFLGHHIAPVGGTLYKRAELEVALADHGFTVEDVRERDPLPHEYPSQRLYVIASIKGGL